MIVCVLLEKTDFQKKSIVTEVGFEPTPEDQCLKLAP